MGNSITSMKEILRLNFSELFERINGVEEILKKDPVRVYENMDYRTKEYYRAKIKSISEEAKISETYVANKVLKLAERENKNVKKKHVGYYLISDGVNELKNEIGYKKRMKKNDSNKEKADKYINSFFTLSITITILFGIYVYYSCKNLLISIISSLILLIPISEIVIQTINYILSKKVKPKLIPKMDYSKGISKESSTMIIIPTIIKNKEKVKELMQKLEVYYLANKSDNLYFTLLGDCTSSDVKNEQVDEEIVRVGIEETKRLNEKYRENNLENSSRFYFLYRKREWNPSEKCYMGWERKRGLICQLNEFLLNNDDKFLINTMLENKPDIKYVITLDVDTNLVLGTALELIGTMAHILNKPVLNDKKDIVIEGHGLIQPRVGINLEASRRSLFTKIYAGAGGTDSYTNAISDVYAMGGEPINALTIVAFPIQRLSIDILRQILIGASDKADEAGVPILGGH